MAKIQADYCINPDCRQIIKYEEGTPSIQCPWCNNRYLTREFKGEQQRVFEDLLAGKQAKAALDLTLKEKEALQALLNESQQKWISNAEIQKYIREKLDVIHDDVKDIHVDTTVIKEDTKQLIGGQTQLQEALQGLRDEMQRVAKPVTAAAPAVQPAPVDKTVVAFTPVLQAAEKKKPVVEYAPESDFKVEFRGDECTIVDYTGRAEHLAIPKRIRGREVTVIGFGALSRNIYHEWALGKSVSFEGAKNRRQVSIVIPDSVWLIGVDAFGYCDSLQDIYIPDTVKEIGEKAFDHCSMLKRITLPNSMTKIAKNTFSNCTDLADITIPARINTIDEYAFYNCTSLTSISIPDNVEKIAESTFSHCTSLANVTIPNSVTYIGQRAFFHCTSLTNITLPNGVTTIGSATFGCCSSLQKLVIPSSVISIDEDSFEDCPNLMLYVHRGSYAHKWARKMSRIWVPKDQRVRFEVI